MHQEVQTLPCYARRDEFLQLVRKNQVVILVGETGSGKSTVAPLLLLDAGAALHGKIVVTESRRILAKRLAERGSFLNNTYLGEEIGYQVGMDRTMSPHTKLVYMTEGVLLNQFQSNPDLRGISVVVLDDFHDRSVHVDVLLAMMKALLVRRPDLRLVLTSATMDAERMSAYYNNAPIFSVEGRVFPVDVRYANVSPSDPVDAIFMAVHKIMAILHGSEDGDILCFLPDQHSIETVMTLLDKNIDYAAQDVVMFPLYGQQESEQQDAALAPNTRRRIILSTNIAETGITVPDIVHVVDTGYIKQDVYVNAAMSSLVIVHHSQAGCNQRAGRGGRTQAGICHRLYTQEQFHDRPAFTEPEIKRRSLTQILLDLLCLGLSYSRITSFDFLDPPTQNMWDDARTHLMVLGVLDADGVVTQMGEQIHRLHIDPMPARMVLEALRLGCLDPVLTIAAAFSITRNLFPVPFEEKDAAFASHEAFKILDSDPLTYLNVYQQWLKHGEDRDWAREHFLSSRAMDEITRIRAQMIQSLERLGLYEPTTQNDPKVIIKAVAFGLAPNFVTFRRSMQWHGRELSIHPGSAASSSFAQHFVFASVRESGQSGKERPYMRGVQAVPSEWVRELIPAHLLMHTWRIEHDLGHPQCTHALMWGGTIFATERVDVFPPQARDQIIEQFMLEVAEEGYASSLHPDLAHVRICARELVREFETGPDAAVARQHAEGLLRQAIAERLGTMSSVQDFVSVDFSLMRVEDFLTQEQLTVRAQRIAQRTEAERIRMEMHQRYQAEQITLFRERQERLNELHVQDEAVRAPLRARLEGLEQRLSRLGVSVPWSHLLGSMHRVRELARSAVRMFSNISHAETEDAVCTFESMVNVEVEKHLDQLKITHKAYTMVRELMPTCPLCDAQWDHGDHCHGAHDLRRILPIPHQSQTQGVIGRFVTNKGSEIAQLVHVDDRLSIRFLMEEDCPWPHKDFTSIRFDAQQVILPISLANDVDDIRVFLADLEAQRQAVDRIAQEIEAQRQAVQNGQVAVLTFKGTNASGFVTAVHGDKTYVARYEAGQTYPVRGERWICQLLVKTGVLTVVAEAIPIKKLVGPATQEDVSGFAKEIAEAYPSLPLVVLQ